MEASSELLRDLYRRAKTIRAFDERIRKGMATGDFGFAYWPVEGQEAISAGVCAALEPNDPMVITYRCAADAIAKGVSLQELAAEMMGKATGTSQGRGGAMGINAPDVGLVATTGIVGAGAPIAGGLGLASKLKGDGRVAVVSFGDGATSIGAVHEAMNLAAVWQLPVIFLCHNNLFGEATPKADYTRTENFADRAAGYGMPGVTVDGTDAVAVYEAAREAVERGRKGGGPTFLEAVAFRLNGHYFGDPCAYVPKDELAAAKANEPIGKLRARLVDSGVSEADAQALDQEIEAEVDAAVVAAKEAAAPSTDNLYEFVYAGRSDAGCLTAEPRPKEPAVSGGEKELGIAGAINQGLDEAMARDDSVIILGEDVGDPPGGIFTVTNGLMTKYGRERVRPTPIAEQSIVGAAIGAALAGMRPIPEIMFMDFLGVCLDQIANHAAKLRFMTGGKASLPLTLRIGEGAGSGPQHSQALEAWLMHTPGLKVVVPSTPRDAKGLITSCIDDEDPCVFIENMVMLLNPQLRGPVPEGEFRIPLGLADVKRQGSDVTVVAWGFMVPMALEAAAQLEKDGISAEVVDPRTLVPLDLETIVESVGKTGRLVVAHRATEFCGPGAEIAALVSQRCFGQLKAPVARAGAAFVPVPRAAELEAAHTPDVAAIVSSVRSVLA